jgi:hypothetical protein
MLGEYKVSRCTRRCHTLDRLLREGEWYYSVIFEDGENFLRRDFSAESWTGLPEGGIGYWKNRIPTSDQRKLVLAPNEVLVDLLRQMEAIPVRAKSRFLLALTLLRRKAVRDVTPPRSRVSLPVSDQNQAEQQLLCLEVVADSSRIDVAVCEIAAEEQELLRAELQELLYCEAEPETY